MGEHDLSGKRILISAGPTWVPIDAVRHIGNFATGRLGMEMAREAASRGAEVTLLLGPTATPLPNDLPARVRLRRYTFFDELRAAVQEEVGSGRHDAFLHSAAVSDYAPEPHAGKISSHEPELILRLRPLPKIIDEVKALDPGILLVKFKLEVDAAPGELERIAQASRAHSHADLIVANDRSAITESAHPAVILGPKGRLAEVGTKGELASRLIDLVAERLEGRRVK